MRLRTSLFVALLLGALPFAASAQKDIAQSSALQAAVDSVSEINQSAPSQDDIVSTREALDKVFDVTTAEIKDLLSKDRLIQAMTDKDADIAAFAQSHLETLNDHAAYIDLLAKQTSDETATLDDLKNLAVKVKQWRSEIYEPKTKEIFDLLLFLQARSVLGTANSRLTLITADIKKLNSVASKADAQLLAQLLSSAQKNLKSAKGNLEAARGALLESDTDKKTSAHETLEKKLKASFSIISETYTKIFFQMSRIAAKY